MNDGHLDYEVRIQWADKSIHWIHLKGETAYNLKGQPISMSGVIIDITERKRTAERERELAVEHAARDEAERQGKILSNLFMAAPALICTLLGPLHTFDLVNHPYQQLFPGRELQGKPMVEALPELKGQSIEHILENVYQTGETSIGNEVSIMLDQLNTGQLQPVYFNFVYQAMRDAEGAIMGILVFAFEVTEQILAKRLVENSEENLRLALEAGKMGTWHLDLNTDTSIRSLQHDQIFGYTSPVAEWGYTQLLEHVLPADRPHVATQFGIAREAGELNFEVRITTADNQLRWIAARGITFYDHEQPTRMAGVVMDISERKHAEEKLQQLTDELATANQELLLGNQELSEVNQQLEKVNADLDNFVYAASHDLKSPVVSLQALLTFLTKRLAGKLDEKEQEIVKMIQTSGIRLHKTIQDLTQIAKIQRDIDEEKETVSFSEILSEIQADVAPLIGKSKARIIPIFSVETVVYARGNVRSIVYNLLSNALKYRSPARIPEIILTTSVVGNTTVLEVKDNGLGLTTQQLQNLFTMFKRFHSHVEGSGIGLYMIKRVVENNGGKIEVESKPDIGTTFRIYF